MKIIKDIGGQNTPNIVKFPVDDAGVDLSMGSLVTTSTSAVGGGVIIAAQATPADIVGLLTQLHDFSQNALDGYGEYNLDVDKTDWNEADVDVRPLAVYEAESLEVDTDQDLAAEEAVGQTVIGITAVATNDDFNGCWFYEDGTEQLRFITDSATSGETITVSATTVLMAAAVLPRFALCRGGGLHTTYKQQLISHTNSYSVKYDGIVNSYPWSRILDIKIERSKTTGMERLIPWVHNAAKTSNAKLYHEFVITDHILKTIG